MDEASVHKYFPNQWVRYNRMDREYISQIKGSVYIPTEGWKYFIVNPADRANTIKVSEESIINVESAQ